jgi:hypothetical protein
MDTTSKILLPLDFDSTDKAVAMALKLAGHVAGYKIGLARTRSRGHRAPLPVAASGCSMSTRQAGRR